MNRDPHQRGLGGSGGSGDLSGDDSRRYGILRALPLPESNSTTMKVM
jgi:hypothetical protein